MNASSSAFVTKAAECLSGAEIAFQGGQYNNCANRCYYACFHAAVAALAYAGITPPRGVWGHEFVQAQFVGLLINRRKLYPSAFRGVILDVQTRRNIADYAERNVTRAEASLSLRQTRELCNAIRRVLEVRDV